MRRFVSLTAFIAFVLCGTQPLFAQGEHVASPQGARVEPAALPQPKLAEHDHPLTATQTHAAGTAVTPSEAHTEHGAESHGGHAAAHEEENVSFSDINWAYGLLGESDDPEPSLLFRPKGMPAPFLATFINWLVLVSLIVVFARKQLPAALKKRKASIVQGMEEAARVKAQAEAHLADLERKLSHMDEEMAQLKSDMQRQSEMERAKIIREAEERRGRMERDAARLIMTELEAAKEHLRREVVTAALQQASEQVTRQLTTGDQERLFQEALGSLKGLPNESLGGRA